MAKTLDVYFQEKIVGKLVQDNYGDMSFTYSKEWAVRIIQEYQQLHLSIKDREVFVRALLNAPSPSHKLLKAVKKYKKDVISN